MMLIVHYATSSKRTRVLLVDDHDLFRTGLSLLLAESGIDVAEAMKRAAAADRLRSFPAHVVLMDMSMPGMPGWRPPPGLEQTPARAW